MTTKLILAAALTAATFGPLSADNNRPLGDSRLIAAVPSPGYPEGVAVREGRVYVSGPAAFGQAAPSKIFVYDVKTGAMVDVIAIQNQPGPIFALSCIAFDEEGSLYVIEEKMGVLKINPKTKHQTVYAAGFHPVFTSAFNPPAPLLLNDLAFDKEGNLYVTDTFQATIWRIPPGGGVPQPWFTNSAIDGVFGPNGIRFSADGSKMYFSVTIDAMGGGAIYTLPVKANPLPADLKTFHVYTPGANGIPAPDGIAFGKSGKLYVCLAGSSEISVLDAGGVELTRYRGPAKTNGGSLPWANPANIAFDDEGRRLIVTNHASLVNPIDTGLFAIFDVYVNDNGGKLFGEIED